MDKNVKEVYEKIAPKFNKTRFKVWKCVSEFLDNLDSNSSGLEIGCGNGKNMLYRQDLKMYGVDFCEKFVEICKEKKLNVINSDMRTLPFKDNLFDFTMSVAALHHLYLLEDRLDTIKEQIRVTKKDGLIFILVWALSQDGSSQSTRFKNTDEMVSWKNNDGTILYRYYHLYQSDELESEINNFNNVEIIKSFYENGNYGVIIKKK